jgi:hypothetical protein
MRDHLDTRDDPASLLAEVATGLGRLVKGELALARAEAAQGLRTAGAGLIKAAIAAILALVALNVLAGAAAGALAATGMGPGAAGLIVALVLLCGALILALSARASLRLKGLVPDRALRGLRQDAQAVRSGLTGKETPHV